MIVKDITLTYCLHTFMVFPYLRKKSLPNQIRPVILFYRLFPFVPQPPLPSPRLAFVKFTAQVVAKTFKTC